MARAKKAKISSKTLAPAIDAPIAACWTLALTPYFAEALDARIAVYAWWQANQPTSIPLSSMEAVGVYIVVYWGNYWLNTWPDTIERLEREDADALAALVAPELPPSAVRDRLNPLYAALEPSLFEDDPDTRVRMREAALALSAIHYAEITKEARGAIEKAALLRERVMAEEPQARAFVRKDQDTKSRPAKRIETLVHQRIAETFGISVRQARRILSRSGPP
jgi:hypothetical protein